MSNFTFMAEWPELQEPAQQAEGLVHADPRAASFYARFAMERAVNWVYRFDASMDQPGYDHSLNTLIHQPCFKNALPPPLFNKFKLVQKAGNSAVHSERKVAAADAAQVVKELHHILYWFYRSYSRTQAIQNQLFDAALMPQAIAAKLASQSAKQLKALQEQLQEKDASVADALAQREQQNAALREELKTLQAKVAQLKTAHAQLHDSHDYCEAETRKYLIDQMLREAGWQPDGPRVAEYEVSGMPNPKELGYVDYVLWGDNGLPLAAVEAKRTTNEPQMGRQQAVLYADCLHKMHGQRPLIYYTNGYQIWFWDDTCYPPRMVQGYHTKDELQRIIDRRTQATKLADVSIDASIAGQGRPYQVQAIRSVCEQFEKHRQHKTLLVMATGSGKTRTVIALVDVLMRAGWVKNVLFLADRNALVSQAKKEFGKLLPKASAEILSGGTRALKGRVYLSTYPTMMGLLSQPAETRLFGIGHFDLVIVDEAHRSIYQKYRYIFDYFDALLVGLTATPKSDIDKNTYQVFDIESGVPTFAYESHEAFDDRVLVPPKGYSVPLKFVRRGVQYNELPEDEKEQWESKEQLLDREEVLPSELNQFLYNDDTVDKMLQILMQHGIKVAGGDRLGKTIIFAANNAHAELIVKRYNHHYRASAGKFARVITYKEKYADTLIDEFKGEKEPLDKNYPLSIAVSVDMLDTGIDVPEVVNLVFFKVVQSRVKFLQMLGRGTRLCKDLFAPGEDKKEFVVFDYCQNLEFFEENPAGAADSTNKPLSQMIFEKRLQLATALAPSESADDQGYRRYTLDLLHHAVAGMNLDNFIVRPRREIVERYQKRERWNALDAVQVGELNNHIGQLPTEAQPFNADEASNEIALRFDHLALRLQVARLEEGVIPEGLRLQVVELAHQLEAKATIPNVKQQLHFIQQVQSDEWWQDVTIPMLDELRRRLRLLIQFVDQQGRGVVYTSFTDELGELSERNVVATMAAGGGLAQYRRKVEAYIREHEDHLTIQRIKRNRPVTAQDLTQLEEMLFKASGMSDREKYDQTIHPDKPLGVFIRELVGLDRGAAREAFAEFLHATRMNSTQIQFINTLIDYFTQNGVMEQNQLALPPFSDIHSNSMFGLFNDDQVQGLSQKIRWINQNAEAANDEVQMLMAAEPRPTY
jgi:type I restriction enzyme R subunit